MYDEVRVRLQAVAADTRVKSPQQETLLRPCGREALLAPGLGFSERGTGKASVQGQGPSGTGLGSIFPSLLRGAGCGAQTRERQPE